MESFLFKDANNSCSHHHIDGYIIDLIKILVGISFSQKRGENQLVLVKRRGREVRLCVDNANFNKKLSEAVSDVVS